MAAAASSSLRLLERRLAGGQGALYSRLFRAVGPHPGICWLSPGSVCDGLLSRACAGGVRRCCRFRKGRLFIGGIAWILSTFTCRWCLGRLDYRWWWSLPFVPDIAKAMAAAALFTRAEGVFRRAVTSAR